MDMCNPGVVPLVVTHSRALLAGTPQGATAVVDADVRDPDRILDHAAETLDLARPVALVLFGTMGHVTDDDEALAVVKHLVGAVPAGSYLALKDAAPCDARAEADRRHERTGAAPYRTRTPDQLARFFDGLVEEVAERLVADKLAPAFRAQR